jgi:hypothetical protein
MAPQTLPTKQEFPATGLESVQHKCSICHAAPMRSPVRVDCDDKHPFCKECIVTWLNQPGVETCPMCGQRLFSANEPPAEIATQDLVREQRARRAQCVDAFRACNQLRQSSDWAFRLLRPYSNDPDALAVYEVAEREASLRRAQSDDAWEAYLQLRHSSEWAFMGVSWVEAPW